MKPVILTKKDARHICAKHVFSLVISHTQSKHQFRRELEFGEHVHQKDTSPIVFIWSFVAYAHIQKSIGIFFKDRMVACTVSWNSVSQGLPLDF